LQHGRCKGKRKPSSLQPAIVARVLEMKRSLRAKQTFGSLTCLFNEDILPPPTNAEEQGFGNEVHCASLGINRYK
jgi:hypothetical protein